MIPVPGNPYQKIQPFWSGKFEVTLREYREYAAMYSVFKAARTKSDFTEPDWLDAVCAPTEVSGPDGILWDGPILKPAQWNRHVYGVETKTELKALRHSVARCTPLGNTHWQKKPMRSSALNPRFNLQAGQRNRKGKHVG
jgi:hypothetical protein